MGTKLGGDADPAEKYILCGTEILKVTKIARLDAGAQEEHAVDCLAHCHIRAVRGIRWRGRRRPPLGVAETVKADSRSSAAAAASATTRPASVRFEAMGDRCQTQTALI